MQSSKFNVQGSKKGSAAGRLLVVVLLGMIIVYAGYGYVRNNLKITRGPAANLEKPSWLKTAKEAREEMATVVPTVTPDFVADGYLRLRDEGEETEYWTLLYEEPGNPAVIAYLTFNFRSQCDYGSGEQICNTQKFENGLKVHLEGTKKNKDVTVIKLKVLE